MLNEPIDGCCALIPSLVQLILIFVVDLPPRPCHIFFILEHYLPLLEIRSYYFTLAGLTNVIVASL